MQSQRQPEKRPAAAPPARPMAEPLAEDFFVGKTFTSKTASYTLMNPLGSGGTSLVYLGARSLNRNPSTRTDRQAVAVKLLSDASTQTDPSFRDRFLREAEAMFRLKHPNVIKILDCGISDGVLFLVTEYVQGLSLKGMLAAHTPLPMEYSRKVVSQICAGLGAVHGIGLMYRDMKPDNVLCLDEKPEVRMEGPMIKIIDFGAVKPQGQMAPNQNLTGAGRIIGTPQYMAPEQFGEVEYDKRVDVYSTGLVAYELITGKRPFFATNIAMLIKMQAADMPPMPSEMAPERGIPKTVDTVLMKALAKKPAERFQTIEEFAGAFEEAWHSEKALRRARKAAQVARARAQKKAPPAGQAPRRQLKKAPPQGDLQYRLPEARGGGHGWLKAALAVGLGLCVGIGSWFTIAQTNRAEQRREAEQQELARQEAEKQKEYQAFIESTPAGAAVFRIAPAGIGSTGIEVGTTPFRATLKDSAVYSIRYGHQHQEVGVSKVSPHRVVTFAQKKPHRARK